MGIVFLLLSLLSHASLPPVTQEIVVRFRPQECGPTLPGKDIPYQSPGVGYDTVITSWVSQYRVDIATENLTPFLGYGIFSVNDYRVQAVFPLSVPSPVPVNWTSTTVMYHDRFLYEVLPFQMLQATHTKEFTYINTAFINADWIQSPNVTIKCQGGYEAHNQDYVGPFNYTGWSTGSRLVLTWEDRF